MNPWMEFANNWLLRTTLEGSLLIATVLGLSWTLGRHLGPSWRVALWTLVGLKLLVPAFLPAAPGLGGWFRPTPVAETPEFISWVESDPIEVTSSPVIAPEHPLTSSTHLNEAAAPRRLPSLTRTLFAIWILGVVAFLMGLVWRQRRFVSRSGLQRCDDERLLGLVREVAADIGVNRNVSVLLGPEGATPAVFGAWRCCLILPKDWDTRFHGGVLRYIILHEMEHIRHRDVLLNWIAAAVNALHWFNPLVWMAVSRFQSDRELRCDANTLARLQPEERFEYGRTLLRVQSEFLPAPAIAGVAPCVRNHPTLRHRILMITNPTRRKLWLNAILALGITGLIALSFGSATAEEEKAPKEPEKPAGRDSNPVG
ncbi:MAG: M56 family metallopeptidase, partial [Verrucomicrobiales bacterium]